MNSSQINAIKNESDSFMNYIKLTNKPDIIFVKKENVNECKVNDHYERGEKLYFNTDFIKKFDYDFVLLLILHEIYHFSKQGILDINDVVYIRDCKQWHFMQLCDVEADLQVVSYLKEKNYITCHAQYLKILYKGAFVFRDKQVRYPKLERFIGSHLSVKNIFETSHKVVYLPQLFFNGIVILSIDFYSINLNYQKLKITSVEIDKWEKAFQDAISMSETEYIDLITSLSDNLYYSILQKTLIYES